MDSILMKEKILYIFKVVFITLIIVILIWGLLFLVDYLLFNNNGQTLFTITKVDNVDGNYITTRKGLGYRYITKDDETTLSILGKEIK